MPMLWRQLRYLLLLIVVGLLTILYYTYYMGVVFFTALALPFIMFGILSYLYGRLRVGLVSTAHIVNKGERVPITLLIHNPSVLPITNMKIYITYRNGYSKEKHTKEFYLSVNGRSKTNVVFHLYSEYAGNLIICIKSIKIYDYLKLFSLKKKSRGEVRAAVLPRYYELTDDIDLSRNTIVTDSDQYSTKKSGDDPSEVFAIREYREGDRLQRIHWKLSTKQGQLMIKEFSDPINCSVLILLDLSTPQGKNPLSFMDALLETAISMSYTFIRRGQLHYFSWYDRQQERCHRVRVGEENDLFEAVDGLLQALPYEASLDALNSYIAQFPKENYTDLYYISGDLKSENMTALSVFRAQTRQVIHVNANQDQENEHGLPMEIHDKLSELGLRLWSVDAICGNDDMEKQIQFKTA
ncbi:MAG: hypothetical protein K0R00_3131 [Herbinix sp.]|nr:hypothetical protein [Herbinix sp.]